MRASEPWRDLPKEFGNWNAVYRRFNECSRNEKLSKVFKSLIYGPDLEWKFIDASYVKAPQHSTGAASKTDEGIGLSRGGNTTKIHLATDACGNPIHFKITAGNINDCTVASELIEQLPACEYLIADKGYDSEKIREEIVAVGSIPVIPRKKNSLIGNTKLDKCLYKYRHLVENTFARLKHFRAIATRYDKLKRNYIGMLSIGLCILMVAVIKFKRI